MEYEISEFTKAVISRFQEREFIFTGFSINIYSDYSDTGTLVVTPENGDQVSFWMLDLTKADAHPYLYGQMIADDVIHVRNFKESKKQRIETYQDETHQDFTPVRRMV